MKSDSVFLQETLLLLSKKVGLLKSITLLCLMRSFVYIISAASSVSILCRHKTEDGRPVPLLFRIRLSLFHVFIVSTLFASSLMIKHKHKPRVERFFWIIAMASTPPLSGFEWFVTRSRFQWNFCLLICVVGFNFFT